MDKKVKEKLEENLSKAYSKINLTMKNIYPDKKKGFFDNGAGKEAADKIFRIMEYIEGKQEEIKKGSKISPEDAFLDIIKITGNDIRISKLKTALESVSFDKMLNIPEEGTNFREYLKFMNNLAEDAIKNKKGKELQKFIVDINITPLMGFFQFITSKFQETLDYLFKKPFRFTSKSVTQLINNYGTLVGYYETFVKMMVLSNDLVYGGKQLEELNYNKISKLDFAKILGLTKKINNFDIFVVPYNKKLRNKILHKEFSIDYTNKKIVYKGGETTFKELLDNSKEISVMLLSYAWLYYFDMKRELEKAYHIVEKFGKNVKKTKK